MADSDKSINNLRYNQITQGLEGFGGGSPMWTPLTLVADGGINQLHGDVSAGPGVGNQLATLSPTAAVKSLHADSSASLTGNVQLVSGTGVTLSQLGQAITINASGSGITQLTGDVTAGPGSGSQATTLATVNSNVGSFTNANITVNAKGLITAASNGSSGGTPNVVQTTDLSTVVAAPTPTVTTLAVTITPASSSNRVKITFSLPIFMPNGEDFQTYIYRNGSPLISPAGQFSNSGTANFQTTQTIVYVDSPATTSATTYTLYVSSSGGTGQYNVNSNPNAFAIAEQI